MHRLIGLPARRAPRRYAAVPTVAALVLALGSPSTAMGQGTLSREGALFLLVPIGARTVGAGQAAVAAPSGSEGLWWNPASLARLDKTEVSLSHSQNIVGTGDALTVVWPAGRAGVLAVGAYQFTTGPQDATDQYGVTGTLNPRDLVLVASYSATFGARVSAGLAFKFLQDRLDCTCGIPTQTASTNALDAGLQAVVDGARRVTIGVALRNLGPRLQFNDNSQADPLPTRLHFGAQYRVPAVERSLPGGELRVAAEVVARVALADPSFRAGGEFTYKQQYFLRAGFVGGSGDAAGAAIGLGFARGGIAMDFARAFGGFSSDQGQPPTYLTLRFRF